MYNLLNPGAESQFKEKFTAAFTSFQEGRREEAQSRFADLLTLSSPPASPRTAATPRAEVPPVEALPVVRHHLRRLLAELCHPSPVGVREEAFPWSCSSCGVPLLPPEPSLLSVPFASQLGPPLS